MNPIACWKELDKALNEGDRERIADAAETLIDWLKGGGYAPLVQSGFLSPQSMLRFLIAVNQAAQST